MEIILRCASRKYKIKLDARISVITDVSGDGKIAFVDDIRVVLNNSGGNILREIPDSSLNGDYVYSDMNLYLPRDIRDAANKNRRLKDCLFIVDENFIGLRIPYTSAFMKNSDIRFLVVTRNAALIKLALEFNSLYRVHEDNGVISLVPIVPDPHID